jgi:hypothetical protein
VVVLAQPKMGVVRYLLGRTRYPDNEWTRNREGAPVPPYDLATDTMFEFLGVRVDPLEEAVEATALERVAAELKPAGKVTPGSAGYRLDGRLNESYHAANLLLDQGVKLRRAANGDFLVEGAPPELAASIAAHTGVDFQPLEQAAEGKALRRLRVAVYQRYRGGSTDEGWTRWLLEQYGYPYTTVFDADVKKPGLNERFDVLVLPNDSPSSLLGPADASTDKEYPPEYRSGLGTDGVAALKAFVDKGGRLVAMGDASRLPLEKFGLELKDVTAGRPTKEFYCPGSTLRVTVDNRTPLGYGMPGEALATYLGGNPVFEVRPGLHSERYHAVVRYARADVLQSG